MRAARQAPDDVPQGKLRALGDRLLLGTGEGALELIEVQPAGGRPMPVQAYLRGRPSAAIANV